MFMAPATGIEFGFGTKSSAASGLYVAEVISASDLDYSMALAAMGAPIGPRKRTWEELHRIFGHAHQKAVEYVVKNNQGEFEVDETSTKDYFCRACVEGKMHVAPFPQQGENEVTAVGDLVVTDVWGPAPVESLQRNRYYVSFVDVYSRLSVLYFMLTKDQVKDYYRLFEALVKTQTCRTIKRVQSDNGKEYINNALKGYTLSQGTLLEQTAPYSSSQNGIAERLNHTLADFSRSGMAQYGLPGYLWQESYAHTNFVWNRLPTRATGCTPYEMFYGRKAPLRHMEEFGSEVWVLDQSGSVRKLDRRANKYRFMGFSDATKGFRYYKPESRQVLVSRNVVFAPKETVEVDDDDDEDYEIAELPVEGGDTSSSTSDESSSASSERESDSEADVKDEDQPSAAQKRPATPPPPKPQPLQPPPPPKKGRNPRFVPTGPSRQSTRLTTQRDYRQMHSAGIPGPSNDMATARGDSEDEVDASVKATAHDEDHPTYRQSLEGPEAPLWEAARDEEKAKLNEMGTLKLCVAPPGAAVMNPLWVQVAKQNQENEIVRRRARLVVQGNQQRPGIDFGELFAHVV